jgi:Ca-activated chloride channel family protein
MTEFRFAFPMTFLLLIPALIFLVYRWRSQQQNAPVLRYSDTRLLGGLSAGMRVRLRRLPDVLRLLVWLLLVIALARPQIASTQQTLRGSGIDIALALDISDSMSEPDFNGLARFEAAKSVMSDFITGRTNDRIGLVVFAEDAFYRAPPTLDDALLQRIIADTPLAGEIGLGNRTAIGMGLTSAANMLRRSEAASRVIILLTDGANNAGAVDPLSAAQAVAAFEMRVYTIGLGTPQGDNALDESTLRQIAAQTGGRYFNALTLDDLRTVYEEIDRLERSDIEQNALIRWQDIAFPILWIALLFLLVERILRRTVFQTIP